VWQGLTMGCARCHDHKYDPFSQREYYQLFAFFNNVPEHGRAIKYGNSPPMIPAPTRGQQAQLHRLADRMAEAERRCADLQPEIEQAQADWEKSNAGNPTLDWTPRDGLLAHYPFDGQIDDATGNHKPGRLREGNSAFEAGRLGKAMRLDGKGYVE